MFQQYRMFTGANKVRPCGILTKTKTAPSIRSRTLPDFILYIKSSDFIWNTDLTTEIRLNSDKIPVWKKQYLNRFTVQPAIQVRRNLQLSGSNQIPPAKPKVKHQCDLNFICFYDTRDNSHFWGTPHTLPGYLFDR